MNKLIILLLIFVSFFGCSKQPDQKKTCIEKNKYSPIYSISVTADAKYIKEIFIRMPNCTSCDISSTTRYMPSFEKNISPQELCEYKLCWVNFDGEEKEFCTDFSFPFMRINLPEITEINGNFYLEKEGKKIWFKPDEQLNGWHLGYSCTGKDISPSNKKCWSSGERKCWNEEKREWDLDKCSCKDAEYIAEFKHIRDYKGNKILHFTAECCE